MKKTRCYIYARVSTAIQVDGYSLDAQKDKLRKYAEFQDMEIVGEYSDEGHSGKNIKGRQEFMRMLNDIEDGKDGVDFVLVFKLSRFGRNAADVLSSLQLMQDYGVNFVCVEDGIDSSKEAGELLISIIAAVAEMERENIRVVRVAIQNFLKNPVISMVFGHPNRKISCISPHIRATVLRQPPFFTPKI